jgi:hypothetical protein
MMQSVWVEDEYKLLQGYYSVAPIETSKVHTHPYVHSHKEHMHRPRTWEDVSMRYVIAWCCPLTPCLLSLQYQGQKYRVVSNSSVFGDALAHHVPFDQHFVVSCAAQVTGDEKERDIGQGRCMC